MARYALSKFWWGQFFNHWAILAGKLQLHTKELLMNITFYSNFILLTTTKNFLATLNVIQKTILKLIEDPVLSSLLHSLAHCRSVSFACIRDTTILIVLLNWSQYQASFAQYTLFSNAQHILCCELDINQIVNSLIAMTSRNWNSLPIQVFAAIYNVQDSYLQVLLTLTQPLKFFL